MTKGIMVRSQTRRGFGDTLLAAYLTAILRDNGIEAFFRPCKYYTRLKKFVDCPCVGDIRAEPYNKYALFRSAYGYGEGKEKSVPIIKQLCNSFQKEYQTEEIKINLNYIPMKYWDIPSIPSLDVVFGTKSDRWCPYRDWPHFDSLKKKLDENKISYIDMDEHRIRDMYCLNYVNKAKLYIGIETGMSHFVSQVGAGKTIILQSGFEDFRFWCNYDFECLHLPVDCH